VDFNGKPFGRPPGLFASLRTWSSVTGEPSKSAAATDGLIDTDAFMP
jgi:hypothetical protein